MPLYALGDKTPKVPASGAYWMAPDAQIIGEVILGEDVGVWFGVVMRGDNEPIIVGEGSNVQEHAVVHTDMGYPATIGRGCTIGHHAIVHGATIGDGSLVGMGAIVLNGARVGRNCLIGAGALVTEGKEIPDNSLVLGSPGKVVRTLDEAAIAGLVKSATGYVQNYKRYAATMRMLEPGDL